MPEPNTPEIQTENREPNTPEVRDVAILANDKYGNVPNLLSREVPGNSIIDDQKKIISNLEQINTLSKDPLTGLDNRDLWQKHAIELLQQYNRFDFPNLYFILTFLDIDNFKQVNDKYGHPAGDAVLQSIAQSMKQKFREADALGRYGGDEFIQAGLSVDNVNPHLIANQFEQIRQQISNQDITLPSGEIIKVTQSWGLVIINQDGINQLMADFNINHPNKKDYYPTLMEKIIKIADDQVYNAKDSKRNCLQTSIITKDSLLTPATPVSPHRT